MGLIRPQVSARFLLLQFLLFLPPLPLTRAAAHLPRFVPEGSRFSCCKEECDYVTVDDVMLLYHIEVQHPELEAFKCKNCSPALDPISFAGTVCVFD